MTWNAVYRMAASRRGDATHLNHAVDHRGWYWFGRGFSALAWGVAAGITWLLLATTSNAGAVPVSVGVLLGLVLGQAQALALGYGMGAVAVTAAVDPLDIAAATLSVLMVLAVVLSSALVVFKKQQVVPETELRSNVGGLI